VAEQLPKSVDAVQKLERINSQVHLEPIVADIDYANILKLCQDRDLILDGTDNFEIRFLINDASLETGIPWIYGGCIGSHGQTMTIIPGERACLRCLIESVPDPGMIETCDTAGIIGPAVNVVASFQVSDAMKVLTGRRDLVAEVLNVIDVWDGSFRTMSLKDLRTRVQCPACVCGKRDWLAGTKGSQATTLCGRNAVQVSPSDIVDLDLSEVAAKIGGAGQITRNQYLLRLVLTDSDYELNLFRDGRAIIKGTNDPAVARGLYAKYIGY
jgi:adenylyltransferase/sulfurtransferase